MPGKHRVLTKKKQAELRKELTKGLKKTQAEIANLQSGLSGSSQSDSVGENSYDEEFADSGSATFERERDFSLLENLRDIERLTREALTRMDEGAYGVCTRCGADSGVDRLEAIPYAALCLSCKRGEEHRH